MDARRPRRARSPPACAARSSASLPISVRSRSQANARRPRRGSPAGRISPCVGLATTYAATSAICFGVSWPLNDGMTPLPFVTRSTTSDGRRLLLVEVRADGPRRARVLERVAALAAGGVEHLSCPRPGRPSPAAVVGTVPTTVCGVGVTVSPHPARTRPPATTTPQAARIRARRRTSAESTQLRAGPRLARPSGRRARFPGPGANLSFATSGARQRPSGSSRRFRASTHPADGCQ